ncbi:MULTISPECIES: DUF58 domain-containing protein [unclassified Actinotalea]|uniref:DUF58 domain-containing protein n=1 Tax=unclassified Actinotalea TaxID=2638618 RepID=UPI001C711B58|nr:MULTISPECIES: DUF58 domain-containing protein [unclassified Actinotalea]
MRDGARPTARGLVVLGLGAASLGGGLAAGYGGLVGLGLALLLLVAVAVVSVLLPAPLAIERSVEPERVPRLGAGAAVAHVTNASAWWPLGLTGWDRVGGTRVPVRVPQLRPGASVEVRSDVPTQRRGVLSVGPLVLDRRGVAGLARSRRTHGAQRTVTVLPRLLPVEAPPPGVRRGHVGADERVEHGGTDLVGIREYVPGDDLRRLHWATSARVGTLMVREDADPSQPHLTVLLDDDAAAYAGDGFEEAVDVAASLVAGAVASGSPVRLLTTSGRLTHDVPAGPPGSGAPGALVEEVLTACALLDPSTGRAAAVAASVGVPAPDVLAVVCGAGSDLRDLSLRAHAAPHGSLLVVDPAPDRVVDVVGGTTVVRGPRAEDVTAAWSLAVVR